MAPFLSVVIGSETAISITVRGFKGGLAGFIGIFAGLNIVGTVLQEINVNLLLFH